MFAQAIARLFHMDDVTWKRHTHPLCFWTRLTVMPLLFLAIWSRQWLGPWALGLVAAALLWNWLNARLFPIPRSTRTWIAKGVFGERVWMNRQRIPIPAHHRVLPLLLTGASTLGLLLSLWGLWQFHVPLTLLGLLCSYVGKLWYFDRMVWLYQDMQAASPEYRSWLY